MKIHIVLIASIVSFLAFHPAILTAQPTNAPSTATASAFVVNGFVVFISVSYGGSGYVTPPHVTITGGGGWGATAQAQIASGIVTGITVVNAGSGYTSSPTVVLTPPQATFIESIQTIPLLTFRGVVGTTNQIVYRDDFSDTNRWSILTNLVLTSDPFVFVDLSALGQPRRYYDVNNTNLGPANPDPAHLVWITPGTFWMGSPSTEVGRTADEGPQTLVTLTQGYWIGKYEVSQSQYLAVTGNNPSQFNPGDPDLPVDNLSWFDATNYCAKLTDSQSRAGLLPAGYIYRLPTEAEWEFACRAGSSSRFAFGDDLGYVLLGSYAWFLGNSGSVTHHIGTKLASPWGTYDMYGNVWEWCLDWFGAYPGGTVTDPKGPPTGSNGVLRGGSWSSEAPYCRSATRYAWPRQARQFNVGLRVVLAKP